MQYKIFIIGTHKNDKLKLAKKLIELDDNLSISPVFTNDKEYKDSVNDNYIYYLSSEEIDLAYKNNVLLYVSTNNYISTGITMDSLYSNDIFCMSIKDFNNISNVVFNSKNYEVLIIWLDNKITEMNSDVREDINESKYLFSTLEDLKYLYFLDESEEEITATILDFINGDEKTQEEILLDNK